MKLQLSALVFVALLGCGPEPTQPEEKAPLKTTTQNGITNMAWDEVDLKCTQAEHDFISGKLGNGTGSWDPNVTPWKQVGTDFFLIPEAIAQTGHPEIVLNMVKQLLAFMPP